MSTHTPSNVSHMMMDVVYMCRRLPCSICHIASVFADRRTALRKTWMAASPDSVVVKFVLYEKERNIDVQRESDLFHDIIFVQGGTTTDYRSIVYKTFAFIQVCVCVHLCTTLIIMQQSHVLLLQRGLQGHHQAGAVPRCCPLNTVYTCAMHRRNAACPDYCFLLQSHKGSVFSGLLAVATILCCQTAPESD